mgnify:CR=1 FL=1
MRSSILKSCEYIKKNKIEVCIINLIFGLVSIFLSEERPKKKRRTIVILTGKKPYSENIANTVAKKIPPSNTGLKSKLVTNFLWLDAFISSFSILNFLKKKIIRS